ncbi:hypothetical protein KGQ71_00510 [Patescibacteria group bacterium]|nr:hypothetical protein [Patescibacteria group bacterium]
MNRHQTIWYILLAMLLFAVGFVAYGYYQQQYRESVRSQGPPSLPSPK